jgi:small subunit ribosomal protein S17
MNKEVKKGKSLTGVVVSASTPMTVIVSVVSTHRHPLYRKAVKKTKHFAVHNPTQTIAVGDKVLIRETRPITKTKHFIIESKLN